MYLNLLKLDPKNVELYWTLTWDVFKLIWYTLFILIERDWTLTWDVFKFESENPSPTPNANWTLTWDVFKFIIKNYLHITPPWLNFNMRCI